MEGLADITTVLLWGFLGRDADSRYTPAGKLVTDTSMAVNRFFYEEVDGERVKYDVTTWWRCTLWGDGGIAAGDHWKKGKGFIFKGTPSVDNSTGAPNLWQSREGDWRASYELNVHRWTFAPAPRTGEGYQPRDQDAYKPSDEYEDDDIPF
jgi:single-stranded DNA-binding protein